MDHPRRVPVTWPVSQRRAILRRVELSEQKAESGPQLALAARSAVGFLRELRKARADGLS